MVGMFTPWKSPSATNQKSFLFQHTNRAKYPSKRDWFGLPWWLSGKEFSCQCRRYGFDPRSGEIPHASKQLSLCSAAPESARPGALMLQLDSPCAATRHHLPQWRPDHSQINKNDRMRERQALTRRKQTTNHPPSLPQLTNEQSPCL